VGGQQIAACAESHAREHVEQHAGQTNQEHQGEPDAPRVTLPRARPDVPVGSCLGAVEATDGPRPALPA
jgi:hypothetical protein